MTHEEATQVRLEQLEKRVETFAPVAVQLAILDHRQDDLETDVTGLANSMRQSVDRVHKRIDALDERLSKRMAWVITSLFTLALAVLGSAGLLIQKGAP